MNLDQRLKRNQQKFAIFIGYLLVFLLAFGLGKITAFKPAPPDIQIEEQEVFPQLNSSPKAKGVQTVKEYPKGLNSNSAPPVDGQCPGKIKGNIGSSGKIYHVPGGAFYDRTYAEECFDTAAEAEAAGFRKSRR